MKIKDAIFGLLEYDYVWSKDMFINFFNNKVEITLLVKGDEEGQFDEEQYEAYTTLMKKWQSLQTEILQSILNYYKQERQELGYDIEVNEDYPLIETTDQILEKINLDGIVVQYEDIFEGRDIGLIFGCTWDSENGLGLRLINEKIIEVGYQDVAI